MIENLFIFFVSLFFIIKGATLATKYSFKIAESYRVSKYVVGFFVVAIISIIPETLVSINAALQNVPAMGLGSLFGSNIADLTLIFAIAVLVAGRSLKIESKILKANAVYPFILLIPIALGIDGFYTRWEGLALIFTGIVFYALSFKREQRARPVVTEEVQVNTNKKLDFVYLIIGLVLLLAGSHFVVTSGIEIATLLNLNKAAMGMLFIGLGTTMPELFFCISAVKNNHDSLAIGDVLGTVLADATIVIGILAMVSPFAFPRKIIYIAGLFMVAAAFILFYMMKTGKNLTRSEAMLLIFFWILFVSTELILNS